MGQNGNDVTDDMRKKKAEKERDQKQRKERERKKKMTNGIADNVCKRVQRGEKLKWVLGSIFSIQ